MGRCACVAVRVSCACVAGFLCVCACSSVCVFVCSFVRFVGVGCTVFMRQRNYKERLIKEGKIPKAKDRNKGCICIHIYPEHLYGGLCLFYVSRACKSCSSGWPLLINVV